MRLTVRLFASLRERAGVELLELSDLDVPLDVAGLKRLLEERRPGHGVPRDGLTEVHAHAYASGHRQQVVREEPPRLVDRHGHDGEPGRRLEQRQRARGLEGPQLSRAGARALRIDHHRHAALLRRPAERPDRVHRLLAVGANEQVQVFELDQLTPG